MTNQTFYQAQYTYSNELKGLNYVKFCSHTIYTTEKQAMEHSEQIWEKIKDDGDELLSTTIKELWLES